MSWVKPVYDRTQADVDFANANRDSLTPLRGARNASDLLRITGNIAEIIQILTDLGYVVPTQKSKLAWSIGEVVPESEIDKIRQDIAMLRSIAYILPTTPTVPNLPYLYYGKINDIEKILYDIYTLEERRVEGFIFSGEMYSGEEFFNGFTT